MLKRVLVFIFLMVSLTSIVLSDTDDKFQQTNETTTTQYPRQVLMFNPRDLTASSKIGIAFGGTILLVAIVVIWTTFEKVTKSIKSESTTPPLSQRSPAT